MALQLYNMFSSLVEKIQRDSANGIAVHKVTVQAIKSKLLSDPEFSHIEGLAEVSSCSELFTCLEPHYSFLSWKVISFLSDLLKQKGYFQLVEVFETNLDTQEFPNVISLIPQRQSSVLSSTCSEVTLSLHRQWGIQSMSSLRRLTVLLFSSLARLMTHIAVSANEQGVLVEYRIPKSAMNFAEGIRKSFVLQRQEELFDVLGTFEIIFNNEPVVKMHQSHKCFSLQSTFFNCVCHHSLSESEMLKLMKFLLKLEGTDPNFRTVENGFTALLIAAGNGYFSIFDFLLSIGAEPDTGDNDGFTPLMIACSNGHLDIVKSLVKHCPKAVSTGDSNGITSLIFACFKRPC